MIAAVLGVGGAPDGVHAEPTAEPTVALRLSFADVVRLADRAPAAVRAGVDLALAETTVRAAADRPWGIALELGTEPMAADARVRGAPRGYVDASLRHRLVTGTALALTAHDGVATATAADGRSLALGVTQPLLRGAGATAVDAEHRAAIHDARAVAYTVRAARATLVAQASAAYWELVFAHADVAIRQAGVEAASAQLRLTAALIRGGQVPRSALLAAEQAVDARRGAVIVAEQAWLERAVALRALLGLPLDADHVLVVPTDDAQLDVDAGPALDLAAALAAAARHDAEVAARRATVAAARARRRGAVDRARPALDLGAAATWRLATAAPALTAAPTAPAAPGELRVLATLTLRHDLGGPTAGLRAQARVRERIAELELAAAERRLRGQVIVAVAGVDTARRRRALADEVADRARALVDAETARFTAGGATVFDVLRRQDELEAARREDVRAAVELAIARAELARLTAPSPEDR